MVACYAGSCSSKAYFSHSGWEKQQNGSKDFDDKSLYLVCLRWVKQYEWIYICISEGVGVE